MTRSRPLSTSFLIAIGTNFLLLAAALAATTRTAPAARKPAPRGGASPAQSSQQIGNFRFGADEIAGEPIPKAGSRFTLTGKAWLTGPGRTINAQEISFDLPNGASDISIAHASGNVRLSAVQKGGRKLGAQGGSLIYNRVTGKINLAGGVIVRSEMEEGGSITATGSAAEVVTGTGTNTATLTGGVRLTILKPNTLSGPATLTGANMTVDLDTGKWRIFGGQTNGNFNLNPKPPKAKQ